MHCFSFSTYAGIDCIEKKCKFIISNSYVKFCKYMFAYVNDNCIYNTYVCMYSCFLIFLLFS